MPKNEFLSAKLPGHLSHKDVDSMAKKHGLSRAAFIIKAVENWGYFDVKVLKRLEEYARRLNTSLPVVMENMIIDRLAREAAETKVTGTVDRVLHEFISTSKGMVRGEELYNSLKSMYVSNFEQEKNKVPVQQDASAKRDGKERYQETRKRSSRTWLKPDEYDQLKKEKKDSKFKQEGLFDNKTDT